jgi:polysaccharide biosynthesis protein PslG
MVRRLLLLVALLVLAPAASAAARPAVGIGEQGPAMFSDARWKALHAPNVRVVVSWDVLWSPRELRDLDKYLGAARRAKAKVLVTFAHSRVEGHEDDIPSRATWRRLFRQFRARYPRVKEFQAWNEANHGTQPTSRAPRRAAQLYDVMRSACRGCTISAPAVLDAPNMLGWIRKFERAARHPVRIWSLHNYLDANRGRSIGTRKLLRNVRGQVWFTETGGIANRWVSGRRVRPYTVKHAGKATRQVFKLARLSPRVKRVYFYNWTAPTERHPRWDSALIGPDGRPRPAYSVIRRELAKRR